MLYASPPEENAFMGQMPVLPLNLVSNAYDTMAGPGINQKDQKKNTPEM